MNTVIENAIKKSKVRKATIRHKSSGNIFDAEIYSSFVFLTDEIREISISDFREFFEEIK